MAESTPKKVALAIMVVWWIALIALWGLMLWYEPKLALTLLGFVIFISAVIWAHIELGKHP